LKRIICQQLVGFVHTNLLFITVKGLLFWWDSLDSSMSLCKVLSLKTSLISHHFITRRWSLHTDSLSLFFCSTENVSFDIFFSVWYYRTHSFYSQCLQVVKACEAPFHVCCVTLIFFGGHTVFPMHWKNRWVRLCQMCASIYFHIIHVLTLSSTVSNIFMPYLRSWNMCILEMQIWTYLQSEFFWSVHFLKFLWEFTENGLNIIQGLIKCFVPGYTVFTLIYMKNR
jgi:hypothetical protein